MDPLLGASLISGGAGLLSSLFGARSQASAGRDQANAVLQAGREQRGFDEQQALDVMVRQMVGTPAV